MTGGSDPNARAQAFLGADAPVLTEFEREVVAGLQQWRGTFGTPWRAADSFAQAIAALKSGAALESTPRLRGAFVRWLFVDEEMRRLLTPGGLGLQGVAIDGALDLSAVAAPFGLALHMCLLPGGLTLDGANLQALDGWGNWCGGLSAQNAQMFGDFRFAAAVATPGGFRAFARFDGEAGREPVGGLCEGVFDLARLETRGDVVFTGATIERDGLRFGEFGNARIQSNIDFDFATIRRPLRLLNLRCEGNLSMTCARLLAAGVTGGEIASSGDGVRREAYNRLSAIDLTDGRIDGSFRFDGLIGFARGQLEIVRNAICDERIRATNVRIGGDFDLTALRFEIAPESEARMHETGIVLTNSRIEQKLCLLGTMPTAAAAGKSGVTVYRLFHTRVGTLLIMPERKYWPIGGSISLFGLQYEELSQFLDKRLRESTPQGEDPANDAKRLSRRCLALLALASPPNAADFQPQPYRQMARVVARAGHANVSRDILVEMEQRIWKADAAQYGSWPRRVFLRALSGILHRTIDYGYRPQRALYWIAAMLVAGTAIFWAARAADLMRITDPSIYLDPRFEYDKLEAAGCDAPRSAVDGFPIQRDPDDFPPERYLPFDPLLYSIDTFIPVLDLELERTWGPSPNRGACFALLPADWLGPARISTGDLVQIYLNVVHIPAGWILWTLFLFGISGLARRSEIND